VVERVHRRGGIPGGNSHRQGIGRRLVPDRKQQQAARASERQADAAPASLRSGSRIRAGSRLDRSGLEPAFGERAPASRKVVGREREPDEALAVRLEPGAYEGRERADAPRREQFDIRVLEPEKDVGGTGAGMLAPPGRREAEQGLVVATGRFEIAHGDDDVVESGQHERKMPRRFSHGTGAGPKCRRNATRPVRRSSNNARGRVDEPAAERNVL
jgi:hypothetical protein